MLSLADAVARVTVNCGASVDPVLTAGEITDLVIQTAYGALWGAATVYTYGAVVLPTVRNGHRYRVITAGTGAATEPTWPLSIASTLTDGTATLQEIGVDSGEVYDVKRATWEAFQLKLTKCAGTAVNIGTPGGSMSLNQMVTNLEARARRWQPVGML